jgi:outer membrane protein assembly factor BamB
LIRCLPLALVAALLLSLPLRAENWPEFRGPTGQGIVSGPLPTEWSTEKNVVWKQALPGSGWSSPVIYDGKIYLTASVPGAGGGKGDLSLKALCLDAKTGKPLWDREVFREDAKAPKIHTKNSHASPTPICDGKRLWVHFGHMGTACLDLDGKIIWKKSDLKYAPVHGNGGSPILAGDALVFSIDGSDLQIVIALNKATGKELWRTERKQTVSNKFSFSTPLLIEVDGKQQIISPGSGAVMAYDPKNGKEIWRVRYGEGYSVIPRPVFGHGLLFLGTGYNSPNLLAIKPDGKGDVTDSHVAWKLTKAAPHTPSALLAGDSVFIVSDGGIASCLDAKSGNVHWSERVGGKYSASPLLADDKVYFQNEEGDTVIVKASAKYEMIGKNSLGERTLASPAAVDGALFIRTDKNLYRIENK